MVLTQHKPKHKHKAQIFPFPCDFAYMLLFALQQVKAKYRPGTTRIFTTRGYVWPMKTLDPDYLAPKQFGRFGLFCLCLCLSRISFSLGSSLLLAFVFALVLVVVLASLVKTRL